MASLLARRLVPVVALDVRGRLRPLQGSPTIAAECRLLSILSLTARASALPSLRCSPDFDLKVVWGAFLRKLVYLYLRSKHLREDLCEEEAY